MWGKQAVKTLQLGARDSGLTRSSSGKTSRPPRSLPIKGALCQRQHVPPRNRRPPSLRPSSFLPPSAR